MYVMPRYKMRGDEISQKDILGPGEGLDRRLALTVK